MLQRASSLIQRRRTLLLLLAGSVALAVDDTGVGVPCARSRPMAAPAVASAHEERAVACWGSFSAWHDKLKSWNGIPPDAVDVPR